MINMKEVLNIIDDKLRIEQAAQIMAPHYDEVIIHTPQFHEGRFGSLSPDDLIPPEPVPHYCPNDGCISCWVDFNHNHDGLICLKCLERKGIQ